MKRISAAVRLSLVIIFVSSVSAGLSAKASDESVDASQESTHSRREGPKTLVEAKERYSHLSITIDIDKSEPIDWPQLKKEIGADSMWYEDVLGALKNEAVWRYVRFGKPSPVGAVYDLLLDEDDQIILRFSAHYGY